MPSPAAAGISTSTRALPTSSHTATRTPFSLEHLEISSAEKKNQSHNNGPSVIWSRKNNTAMTWFKFPLHVYISCKVLTSYQLTRNFRTSNVDQPLFPHLSRQFQQVLLFSMRRAAVSTVSPCLPPSRTISSPPTTQAAQAIWPTSPLLDALNKVSSHKRSMLS
jgi:hypothetical protein